MRSCAWQPSHDASELARALPELERAAACLAFVVIPLLGVALARWAVRLFVVRAPGATLSEEGLIAHCRRSLTGYKVPKQVRFLDAMPKSNVGKILRKDLLGVS